MELGDGWGGMRRVKKLQLTNMLSFQFFPLLHFCIYHPLLLACLLSFEIEKLLFCIAAVTEADRRTMTKEEK